MFLFSSTFLPNEVLFVCLFVTQPQIAVHLGNDSIINVLPFSVSFFILLAGSYCLLSINGLESAEQQREYLGSAEGRRYVAMASHSKGILN